MIVIWSGWKGNGWTHIPAWAGARLRLRLLWDGERIEQDFEVLPVGAKMQYCTFLYCQLNPYPGSWLGQEKFAFPEGVTKTLHVMGPQAVPTGKFILTTLVTRVLLDAWSLLFVVAWQCIWILPS